MGKSDESEEQNNKLPEIMTATKGMFTIRFINGCSSSKRRENLYICVMINEDNPPTKHTLRLACLVVNDDLGCARI
jgi:hypothetical protein